MSYTSHQDRGTKAPKSSWLITLLITLVALVAVGCGDSNEDYVYTGTGPNVGPTGNVTFLFEQATPVAAKIVAPADARFVKFTFFNKDGVAVLKDVDNRAYAASITVANVPVSATSYKIDFFAANGTTAVGTPYTGNVTVEAGKTTIVDPSVGPQPVLQSIDVTPSSFTLALNGTKTQQLKVTANYSGNVIQDVTNGSTFASSAAAIASVNTAGLVTAVAAGDATVTATFGNFTDTAAVKVVAGEDPVPPVGTLVATPSAVTLTNATTSVAIATTYDGAAVNATGTLGAFTGNVTATNLVYAAGSVTSTAAVNGSATLTLSYLPEGAEAPVTTTVDVQVERAADEPTPPTPGAARIEANFDSLVVDNTGGVPTGALKVTYFAAGATTGTDVTAASGVTFGSFANGAVAGHFVYSGGAFETDSVSGSAPAPGATAVATITYNVGGQSLTDTINLTAGTTAQADVVVSAQFVTVGDSLVLSGGSTYPLAAAGQTASGNPVLLDLAPGNGYTVTNVGGNIATATYAAGTPATSRLLTASAVGTTTIELRSTGTGTPLIDSIQYTGIAAVASYVSTVSPANISFVAGTTGSYRTILTYASGETQDVTPVFQPAYTVTTGVAVVPGVAGPGGAFPGTLAITGTAAATGTLSTATGVATTGFNIVGARTDTPANVTVTAAP